MVTETFSVTHDSQLRRFYEISGNKVLTVLLSFIQNRKRRGRKLQLLTQLLSQKWIITEIRNETTKNTKENVYDGVHVY